MVSIDTLLSKVKRDGLTVDEATAVEWIAEALDFIGVVTQYEQAVAFIEVKDYQAPIPQGLTHVTQLARNNCFVKEESCPAQIVEELSEDTVQNFVPIDCNGTPVAEYEMAFYRPFANLIYEYEGWSNSGYYTRCFSPIRLSHHTFFNTIVCQEDFVQPSVDSYTINHPYFILSFQEGQIAVSYRRVKVDERGFPMIPNYVSYQEACVRYIRYKQAQMKYDEKMDNATLNYLTRADQEWQWMCKQAGNQALMVKGVDGYQDLLDQKSNLMPRLHRYSDFFENLNRPESRRHIR